MEYHLIATCPEETKDVLCSELQALGAKEIRPSYMAVHFVADEELYYLCHLRLASASHIFRVVKSSAANDVKIMFSQAKRIKWHKLFDAKKTFRVDPLVSTSNSSMRSSILISKVTRSAIEDDFAHHVGEVPQVDLKEPDVVVCVYLHKNRAMFSLRTSGETLHKRNYRLSEHPAPLKETLAHAILRFCDYHGEVPLLDPMCGSGTLVIEAALLALNKAPGIHRKKGSFGFEFLSDFNKDLWKKIQEEARAEKKSELTHPIMASDISSTYVDLAKRCALRARVEKFIDFQTSSFFDLKKPCENGLLVSNLPYGSRLELPNGQTWEDFFARIGDHLKHEFKGWSVCLMVPEEAPWKSFRLKPKATKKVLNGSIQTKLLFFDLY